MSAYDGARRRASQWTTIMNRELGRGRTDRDRTPFRLWVLNLDPDLEFVRVLDCAPIGVPVGVPPRFTRTRGFACPRGSEAICGVAPVGSVFGPWSEDVRVTAAPRTRVGLSSEDVRGSTPQSHWRGSGGGS